MSVLIETSAGDIVVDLFVEESPIACENFLTLCFLKYYNNCLFYNVQTNYIAQTGDPTGTGRGGVSARGFIEGRPKSYIKSETSHRLRHDRVGLVSMASEGVIDSHLSQFFITLRGEDMGHLNAQHTIFAEVAEGFDVLDKINSLYCDESGRPYQDLRIRHTYILDNPFFPKIRLVRSPPSSPTSNRPLAETVKVRIPYEKTDLENDNIDDNNNNEDEQMTGKIESDIRKKEAVSRAVVLEMTGDIPDADAKPPEEVLFICKLNPITTDDDLEIIFSRFGEIKQCEIIRDSKTGESLCYAFIEFATEKSCIEAYEKMNNVLIDDRRVKVDFSQSVSKLWNRFTMKSKTKITPGRVGEGFKVAAAVAVAAATTTTVAASVTSMHDMQTERKKSGSRVSRWDRDETTQDQCSSGRKRNRELEDMHVGR
jgi:peptidyl-prolyl cis-trans isomerase-like 4